MAVFRRESHARRPVPVIVIPMANHPSTLTRVAKMVRAYLPSPAEISLTRTAQVGEAMEMAEHAYAVSPCRSMRSRSIYDTASRRVPLIASIESAVSLTNVESVRPTASCRFAFAPADDREMLRSPTGQGKHASCRSSCVSPSTRSLA